MRNAGFCERKFHSMLFTGTFTMAVIYIMLLCDNIIAGHFIGDSGVAAINAVTPVTSIVTFFSSIIAIGSGILYSRDIGAMKKQRANEIFGQGLIISISIAAGSALLLVLGHDLYFRMNGVSGEIYELAEAYYRYTPVNSVLSVLVYYLTEMVYTDGDVKCNNVSYVLQIGGNIIFSVILAGSHGMAGIIIGTMIGNVLGLLAVFSHFFKKSNTLHFAWHFSLSDFAQSIRFSIVDAAIYLCWAVADYVLIGYVSGHYGEPGLVTLAVVISLIEFGVVLDGVGMAVQPLLGTYLGEGNNVMIKRLTKSAVKAALLEGLAANVLVFVFARQFCGLFGIGEGETLASSISAIRIVSTGMVFCSLLSLVTSYYMLIDHVLISTEITVLKDGVFYSFLPLIGSELFGENAMWAAFAVAPLLALVLSLLLIRLCFGKEKFPYLLEGGGRDVVIIEKPLTPENCARLSEQVEDVLMERGCSSHISRRAALFTEEIGLTVLEKNKAVKKLLMMEISLFFEEGAVVLVARDSGRVFDITDPDIKIDGLSSFTLSRLLKTHKSKSYLTTTGYNRNMIRFDYN